MQSFRQNSVPNCSTINVTTSNKSFINATRSIVDKASWSERIGGVLELLANKGPIGNEFRASLTEYTAGEIGFSDLHSHSVRVDRSLIRISLDRPCNFFLFTVCVDDGSHSLEGRLANRRPPAKSKILAIDLDQPINMNGHRYRFSAYFVPRALLESILPNSDSLHGRSIGDSSPLARQLIANTLILNDALALMTAQHADFAFRNAVQDLADLFGKQAHISGHARAAARAVMFSQARSFIRNHFADPDLTAEKVLLSLQLPRDTLYRMFEHEGGIAAFICDCRIRAAAEDIIKCPSIHLKDIAYGVGFTSASTFSRTFKREYGISPQDLRAHAQNAL